MIAVAAFESFQYLLEKKACMADICEWINDVIGRHLTSRVAVAAAAAGGDEVRGGGHGLAPTAKKFLEAWRTISNWIFRALCSDDGPATSRPNSDAKSKKNGYFLPSTAKSPQDTFYLKENYIYVFAHYKPKIED